MADDTLVAPPPPAQGPAASQEDIETRIPQGATPSPELPAPPPKGVQFVERTDEVPTQPWLAPHDAEPVQYGAGPLPKEPVVDPATLPTWDDIANSPTYQGADANAKKKILDAYANQAKLAGHESARQNNEDPAIYDQHVADFYDRASSQIPYNIFDNTVKAVPRGAIDTTLQMAQGAMKGAKDTLYPEIDLSDIKSLSVDEAKHQRAQLDLAKPKLEEDAEAANDYLKNPLASLQDPEKHPIFPGARTGAINAIRNDRGTQTRIDALDKYIDSNGKEIPQDSMPTQAVNAAETAVSGARQNINQILAPEDIYVQQHPKLNSFLEGTGRMLSYLAGHAVAAPLGPEAEMATDALMNYSDAFQTGYEGAQAKIAAREKAGEYFTPYDKERMATDAATSSAFGVGSFQTLSNLALGSALHGLGEDVKVDPAGFASQLKSTLLNPKNLVNTVKNASGEIGGQVALQGASNVLGNLAMRSADPNQDLTEGLPESLTQGLIYGGTGAMLHMGASALRSGIDNFRIDQHANDVRTNITSGVLSEFGNLTNEQKTEVALTSVPPEYRDQVRAKLAIQESSKDQAQVAANLNQANSPATAQEMQKQADATANTRVTPVVSAADRLRQKAEQDLAAKRVQLGETKPAAAPTETAPATTPETAATTTPGAATTTPTETPAVTATGEPAVAPKPSVTNEELLAKIDQVLGPDATPADKLKFANDYTGKVTNTQEQEYRSPGLQLMHELGLNVKEGGPAKTWAKNTPPQLAEARNRFSSHLDDQIAKNAQAAQEQEQGAQAQQKVQAVTGPDQLSNVLPPSMLEDAFKSNDPSRLLHRLRQGDTMQLTDDQLPDETYDFLTNNNILPTYDENTKMFSLNLGTGVKRYPTLEEQVRGGKKGLLKGKQVTDQGITFNENTPDFTKEINDLPAHPNEDAFLTDATKQLNNSENQGTLNNNTKVGNENYATEAASAATASYQKALRNYAETMREQGKEDVLKLSPAEARARTPEKEEPKLPSIQQHIKSTLSQFYKKRAARNIADEEGVKHATTTGLVGPEGETIDIKDAGAVIPGTEKEEAANAWTNLSLDHVTQYAQDFLKGVPKEKREQATRGLYYALNELYDIPIPEGVKSSRGVPTALKDRLINDLYAYIERFHGARGEGEAEAGAQPAEPDAGKAANVAPIDQPEAHAAAPPGNVPGGTPDTGQQVRPADQVTGGREPGLPGAGETAPGQAGAVLHEPGQPEGGAGTGAAGAGPGATTPGAGQEIAGAAGGERAEPAAGTLTPTVASRESTIHVQPRPGEETIPRKGEPAGGGEPGPAPGKPEPRIAHSPQEIADKLISMGKKGIQIADEFGIEARKDPDVENHHEALAEHIAEVEAGEDDPEHWYRELYDALGLKQPDAAGGGPALKAPEVSLAVNQVEHQGRQINRKGSQWETTTATGDKRAFPTLAAAKNFIEHDVAPAAPTAPAPKPMTPGEQKALESRFGQLSNLFANDMLAHPEKMAGWGYQKGTSKADLVQNVSEALRGMTAHLPSFEEKMEAIRGIVPEEFNAPEPKVEGAAAPAPEPQAPVQTPSVSMQEANESMAKELHDYFIENPERAVANGVGGMATPKSLMAKLRTMGAGTPEDLNLMLRSLGQREGVIDPSAPPGGTKSSGVMNSLVPGIKAAADHGFTGKVKDLVQRFRTSPDPEMQAFARSLNAHRDNLQNMPIRQLDHTVPAIFYHDGELWVTPSALGNASGEHALAHEVQHAIAQERVTRPNTQSEHDDAAHWDQLRNDLRNSLPADLRDALDSYLPKIFSDYNGREEMDTRELSHEEKNWLPILYAAHSGENMLHAAFSNGYFREHLAGIRYPGGETLLSRVHDWGQGIFGSQAFKYADEAHPLVSDRPGIPAQFNPKTFDLKNSYPLTESEKHVQRITRKYQLDKSPRDALRQVEALSDDPRHKAIAQALGKALEAHPEIKIALENRIGGYAGGYDFDGDRVTVNPHYSDHDVEGSVIHEIVHALTLGKIDAFEQGQLHLLNASDMHAVSELETLRQTALDHKNVPQIIRDISELPDYQRREKALLDLFQRHPEMQKWYGLTDTREFASEALSNGALQDHLKQVRYAGEEGERPRSMLGKVFDWVKKFLGFPDNSVLSHAIDNVATLMGGRRVMESSYEVGDVEGRRTMAMQENLLAKRYLDQRAQAEGFSGARNVPHDQLNSWLQEYRENQGMGSRGDPYAARKVAPPEVRAHYMSTEQSRALTDPREILDHLSKVSGTVDPDGLRTVADRAFRDKAITDVQYVRAHQAIDGLERHTVNKLHINLSGGDKEDRMSPRETAARWVRNWRPRGELPPQIFEAIQDKTSDQHATAMLLRNRIESLDRAVKQNYKTTKLTPEMRDDMNAVLEGRTPTRNMPTNVVNALMDMRAMIDAHSIELVDKDMVTSGAGSPMARAQAVHDKTMKIVDNLGKYVSRSYRYFDDPRYRYRDTSKQYRAEADRDMGEMVASKAKKRVIEAEAVNAGEAAARAFTPSTTAYNDAYKKAYDDYKANKFSEIGHNLVEQRLDEWQHIAENKETGNLQYGHAYAVDPSLLKELSNLPESMRKLIGEEDDPRARFAKTVWRQESFIGAVDLGRRIAAEGKRAGYISDDWAPGLTRQIPAEFSHLGELAGKYTKPEFANALTDYSKTLRAFKGSPILNVINSLEGKARYMTTIGSLQRGMGNVWGGVFAHINNGYVGILNPDAWRGVMNGFKGQLLRMNTPEREAYMEKLNRLGISDKSGNVNVLFDFLKSGEHLGNSPLDTMQQLEKWSQKTGLKGALSTIHEKATDFHTISNFLSKISQWEQEKTRQRAIDAENVREFKTTPLTPDEIDQKAARIVRDTNIDYSMVSPNIKSMRQTPVLGTFLTFWNESIRSYVMGLSYALKYIDSRNSVERRIGYQRLGGLMAATTLPFALQAASQRMFNVSDKEDRAFRALLPPWEQHNSIFYGPMINKRRNYTNLNYISPQGDVGRAINAMMAPNPQGVAGQVRDSAYEMFHSVFNLGLIPGSLVDVARNQTEYGTQVYNPDDHWMNQLGEITGHVLQRGFGGTVGRMPKIVPAMLTPGGKVSPGGSVFNWQSSVVPEVTGLNIREMSFPERFRSELYSSKDSIDHAQMIFTGPIQRSGNALTDQQMRDLYQRSEDARRNVFNNLHEKVEAARYGGMSSTEIVTALKARRYSNQVIDDIMTGRYRAYKPSAGVLKNARANRNFVPPSMFSRPAQEIEDEE